MATNQEPSDKLNYPNTPSTVIEQLFNAAKLNLSRDDLKALSKISGIGCGYLEDIHCVAQNLGLAIDEHEAPNLLEDKTLSSLFFLIANAADTAKGMIEAGIAADYRYHHYDEQRAELGQGSAE
jgi:hypothetical protein